MPSTARSSSCLATHLREASAIRCPTSRPHLRPSSLPVQCRSSRVHRRHHISSTSNRQPSDPYVTPPGTVYGDNGIIPPSGMPAPQRAKVNGILTTGQKVGYTLLPMFLGVIGFLIVWLVCRDDGDDFNRAAVRQALIGFVLGIVMWVVIAILALVCIFGLLAVVIAAAA